MVWGSRNQGAATQNLQEPGAEGPAGGEQDGLPPLPAVQGVAGLLVALLPGAAQPFVPLAGAQPLAVAASALGTVAGGEGLVDALPLSSLSLSCVSVAQCDGRPIPLPSLQGIAVLNIPSYAGGTNFWGGTKEDDVCMGVLGDVGLGMLGDKEGN